MNALRSSCIVSFMFCCCCFFCFVFFLLLFLGLFVFFIHEYQKSFLNPCHAEQIKMSRLLITVRQSGCLMHLVNTNSHTE